MEHYASSIGQNNYLQLSECNEISYLDSNVIYLSTL